MASGNIEIKVALNDSSWMVFLVFLRVGLTSFGGPVAHLGYFRDEFVTHRRWLSERSYADLIVLCQVLPAAKSAWDWAWCEVATVVRWRPGPDLRCHQRS
jgi:chromate transporter